MPRVSDLAHLAYLTLHRYPYTDTSVVSRGSLGLWLGELLGYGLAESLGVAIGVVAAAVGDAAWLLTAAG